MFVICTWNMARITHHMMFYLFMNFLSSNAAQIASFYVEKTHESPKSSCVEITNILGIERCAVKCLNTIATTYMFSVNKNQRKCLCCPDLTGSDITDPEWESFIPRKYCAILSGNGPYQSMIIIFVEIYFSVFKVYSASVGNFCWFTKTWDLVVKQDTEFAVIPYENEAQVMLLFTFTKFYKNEYDKR